MFHKEEPDANEVRKIFLGVFLMTVSRILVINFESLFNSVLMGFKVPLELGLAIHSALY